MLDWLLAATWASGFVAGVGLRFAKSNVSRSAYDLCCFARIVCPLKPGPAPAGGLLSLCEQRKYTKKVAPLQRPLLGKGFPALLEASGGCGTRPCGPQTVLATAATRRNPTLLCCSAFQRGLEKRRRLTVFTQPTIECAPRAEIREVQLNDWRPQPWIPWRCNQVTKATRAEKHRRF